MGHKIGYARVSTADQNPQLQLDALAGEDCLKTYIDTATGTKADRPQWNACLADLRPSDTLTIWKIDRLGRNLCDLIDIVTGLEARGVAVKSLTNGIVDTTTAHGKPIFGMFALMAEYEAALITERTLECWRRLTAAVRLPRAACSPPVRAVRTVERGCAGLAHLGRTGEPAHPASRHLLSAYSGMCCTPMRLRNTQ